MNIYTELAKLHADLTKEQNALASLEDCKDYWEGTARQYKAAHGAIKKRIAGFGIQITRLELKIRNGVWQDYVDKLLGKKK